MNRVNGVATGPSKLVAFVRQGKEPGRVRTEGPILWANGEFLAELKAGGWDLGDHNLPDPSVPTPGLWIFEGWIEVGCGEDPDIEWEGDWRRLTHWEMCQLRFGLPLMTQATPESED